MEETPLNCWLSPIGEAHEVQRSGHARVARSIANDQGEGDTDNLFRYLYELGYVRVQWEHVHRVNIAFHYLSQHTYQKVYDLVDILIHSGASVYLVAPHGDEFIQPGQRAWKRKFKQFIDETPAQADRFLGRGHKNTAVPA